LPGKATIRASDEKQVSTKPPPPLAGVSEIACLCSTLSCSRITIIKASASYFACVSPATTAASLSSVCFVPSSWPLHCVLHGFISNEGEFRLAVSNILKKNHVVHIVYGLMFYSVLRRLNPVSLRRFAYVAVSRASQDAMLFTDNAAQLGPQLAVETSKTAVLDAEQVTSIANAVGMSR
jgi:hypothetical protein